MTLTVVDDNDNNNNNSNQSMLSKVSTALSNFVVQYNYGSMSCALLIMSTTVCTYDDDTLKYSNCQLKGEQREWVEPTSNSIGNIIVLILIILINSKLLLLLSSYQLYSLFRIYNRTTYIRILWRLFW